MPTPEEEREFIRWLRDDMLYLDPRVISPGYVACIYPLLYTHAIILVQVGDTAGYCDRWCYHTYEAAKEALDAWQGQPEPSGWHRHPKSGRRIIDGNLQVWA